MVADPAVRGLPVVGVEAVAADDRQALTDDGHRDTAVGVHDDGDVADRVPVAGLPVGASGRHAVGDLVHLLWREAHGVVLSS